MADTSTSVRFVRPDCASISGIRQALVEFAESTHAAFPQYRGHWDSWLVATVARDLSSKGKQIASLGEFVLVDPASITTAEHPDVKAGFRAAGMITAFLPNHWIDGGCDTSVRCSQVEVCG